MVEKVAFKIIQWIGSTNSLITHTLFFIVGFILYFSELFNKNTILLIITLLVSLEAIYLSIFIQMSVNSQTQKLQDVADDVEEIQVNVEEIQETVDDEDEEDDEDIREIQETLNKLMKEVLLIKRKNKI